MALIQPTIVMKFVLHLEHLRYFQNKGFILFEQLLPNHECALLEETIVSFIQSLAKHSNDSRWIENLYRSIPMISRIVKKRHLDRFAAELVHRQKLSLINDIFLDTNQPIPEGTEDCHLLLHLSGKQQGQGMFFSQSYPKEEFPLDSKANLLLLAFSSKGLPIA